MAKAGTRARRDEVLVCRNCLKETPVRKGETIPPCPCGAGGYHDRGTGTGLFRRGSAGGKTSRRRH
ncbi:MAG: hypothetical protein PHG91_06305 [Syntrophales bacterium]|nr:hypothetical protein [Syntrophales bacterium]MDD5232988.1 hypothetical protein [Syntrophales bacterium]MDD5531524.1 hypothetical protein [Syntrophales bacterium]